MRLLLDFETKSDLNVAKVGADRYAEDPSTEILTLAWQIDDREVETWSPFLGVEHEGLQELFRIVEIAQLLGDRGKLVIEAHNIRFERAIWREIMAKRLGAPPIAGLKMSCTMARCGYRAVPIGLEDAAAALDLRNQKDMKGHKAMQALARGHVYKDPGTQFIRYQECIEYCAQDIRVERELGRVIGDLSPAEQRVFELDMLINDRGVRLDIPFVKIGSALCAQYVAGQSAKFKALTGGLTPSQRDKVLAWCNSHDARLENLQQATVDNSLALGDLPPLVVQALELRKSATRAAAKKYDAMLRTVCADGRAHGVCQYHGAGTGRWAGRLIQPQNFIRPEDGDASLAQMVEIIKAADLELLEAVYGDPIRALSDATRAAIIPGEKRLLSAGDLASIETHVLMWLAGEEEACKFLATGQKLYIPMAEEIYRRPIDKKKDLKEYTVGKIAILQLGYQAGWRGFQESVRTQGGVELSDEECQMVVNVYRKEKYPKVPALWRGLEDAMFEAVAKPGTRQEFRGIEYHLPVGSRWLECRLPSGRRLHYFDPAIVKREMPWTNTDVVWDEDEQDWVEIDTPVHKECVRYFAQKEGQLKPVYAYGGHDTENVVQAISRDFMVCGMFRAERAGLPVVMTVHDEIVTEHDRVYSDPAKTLEQCMTELPRWGYLNGLWCPMGASCWTNERYVK